MLLHLSAEWVGILNGVETRSALHWQPYKVSNYRNISVHFKFADESHNLAEYIEHNTTGTAEAGAPAKAQNPFDGAFF